VEATSIFAATIRVRATITKKKNYGLPKKLFSFRGLTNKEINVIMGLGRKVWG
jgi:hypothetical protein